MPFTHIEKIKGDLIKSEDWNSAMKEIVRVGGVVDGVVGEKGAIKIGDESGKTELLFRKKENNSNWAKISFNKDNDAETRLDFRVTTESPNSVNNDASILLNGNILKISSESIKVTDNKGNEYIDIDTTKNINEEQLITIGLTGSDGYPNIRLIKENGDPDGNSTDINTLEINLSSTSFGMFKKESITFQSDIITINGQPFYIGSDLRLKSNIEKFEYGLRDLLKLNPVTFEFNGLNGISDGRRSIGLIAQEVKEVIPELIVPVYRNEDVMNDDVYLNVRSLDLIYVAINAIKDLNQKIEKLEKEFKIMKKSYIHSQT
jgi:hypothetical protein